MLILEHVGLTHVLDLTVHLVNFFGWMSQGGYSEQLLLLSLFYQSTASWLKVMGGVVAHVIFKFAYMGKFRRPYRSFPIRQSLMASHLVLVRIVTRFPLFKMTVRFF